ncbi:protease complex subunit PrcB family protein [Flavobacterium algicola]|uniref:protease complex subunit PrcB family protein n=1 Tax=Flavobacterium algicola TaxID=556529 RepID=UPI001EFED1B5|nr:protease complex subunit PrcB family protein [Flavobacterium algicola]MCG9792968.1 protease complex subunit PrcB family protein [Flavobacterium algicola]
MKKLSSSLLFCILIASCGPKITDKVAEQPLFEVLTQQSTGGANIKFSEILSEPNEIKMLQNDPVLKKKISEHDVQNSNFLILNMGEQISGGYKIGISSVEEKKDSIIVTVKEQFPEPDEMVTQAITYPYCVLKINSKKPIAIK